MLDTQIFYQINHLPHSKFSNEIAVLLHYGTKFWIVYVPFVFLFFRRTYRTVGASVILSILSTSVLVDVILKHLINRPRPFLALQNVIAIAPLPYTSSFPSGQSAVAAAVTTTIILLTKSNKKYWLWLWPLLIGLDRIYMGHHYPSDVIVGILIGVLVGYLVTTAVRKTSYFSNL